MTATPAPHDWDAATYERVAAPQEEWAREVLERLPLRGDETVLDAGCGGGRVTRLLVERLPRGRVIAVDASPSMVAKVGSILRPDDRALTADLAELRLDEAVDAVFSTAVFHWILDHDSLFRRLYAALRPGGRLEAQCGGSGNVEAFLVATVAVGGRDPYAPYLGSFEGNWRFAGTDETAARLEAAGYEGVHCWLDRRDTRLDEPTAYLRAVCLGPHLEQLPATLHDRYVADVLEEVGAPLVVDYVRLHISARRPA